MSDSFPLPDVDWEPTRGFWQAAERHELQLPCCQGCGQLNWYPSPQCRYCKSESLSWSSVSGRATLFSWSHVTRALFKAYSSKAPYTTGLVALEEDPRVRLVTLLVDCDPAALRIDMPVEVVFRTLEFPDVQGSVIAPMFRPV